MVKKVEELVDENLQNRQEEFIKSNDSAMFFTSELSSDLMDFSWLKEVEFACPYIDNTIRNPKLALITEEDVVKIEKAKKISVASIKDLSKHTQFIDKIDPITNEVQPSKILITRNEETFNIYENRFIYTLVDNLSRFMAKRETILEKFEVKKEKDLEYAATTNVDDEKINIELKISSKEVLKDKSAEDFQNEIEEIKIRVKKIREYINNWYRSEMIKSLIKNRAPFVMPPIKKTNVILKNPNFQIAMKLWSYLQTYGNDDDFGTKDGQQNSGTDLLKGLIDDTFLINYFVLNLVGSSRKRLKEQLPKYAISILTNQVKRTVEILMNYGIKLTDEEIMAMIASELNSEKNKHLIGSNDVKEKFKNALDEYLERVQDYI